MPYQPKDQSTNIETGDDTALLSRRSMLRRTVLGITGVSAATVLAACGGEDDPPPAGSPGDDLPANDEADEPVN